MQRLQKENRLGGRWTLGKTMLLSASMLQIVWLVGALFFTAQSICNHTSCGICNMTAFDNISTMLLKMTLIFQDALLRTWHYSLAIPMLLAHSSYMSGDAALCISYYTVCICGYVQHQLTHFHSKNVPWIVGNQILWYNFVALYSIMSTLSMYNICQNIWKVGLQNQFFSYSSIKVVSDLQQMRNRAASNNNYWQWQQCIFFSSRAPHQHRSWSLPRWYLVSSLYHSGSWHRWSSLHSCHLYLQNDRTLCANTTSSWSIPGPFYQYLWSPGVCVSIWW